MRIFIVGSRWVGEWPEGLMRAAVSQGHTTTLFYYGDESWSSVKSIAKRHLHSVLQKGLRVVAKGPRHWQDTLMNRRLVAAAHTYQPNIIVILKGETISRKSLLALKAMNVPIVSWWLDDPFRFPEFLHNFELFDKLYVFDRECVANLKSHGIKQAMYLPCACDPTIFYPQSLDPINYPDLKCTIGLVATYFPVRAALLNQMKGWDVGLWGEGWDAAPDLQELPHSSWRGPFITAANAAKVYNLASICPNVHHPQTRFGGLNMRTFEILAAGGFELVDNIPGLEENFDVGREIVAYSSPANFRELTEYFLSHPDERAAIIEKGRARVIRDHTYERRLEVILKTLDR